MKVIYDNYFKLTLFLYVYDELEISFFDLGKINKFDESENSVNFEI